METFQLSVVFKTKLSSHYRCNFKAYCVFSFLNTIVYCIPAGWVWGEHGFLHNIGAVDIAGSGPVHLIGGASALASAAFLGPRLGRYTKGLGPLPLGNPVNACMGLFVLWWGWLAFNSGSTYGVSGSKWQYAARAAVMTMMGSFGGGIFSLCFSLIRNDGRMEILDLINGILGSLVSITAGCFLYHAWEAIIVGTIGSLLVCVAMPLFDKVGIDDPVGATSVHGVCGIWGVLAVGLFADNPIPLKTTYGRSGLFKGGGWYMIGAQSLEAICLLTWGFTSTFILLWIINKFIPIRMDPNEELLGADLMEHHIRHGQIGLSRAISAVNPPEKNEILGVPIIGMNPGHEKALTALRLENKLLKLNQQVKSKKNKNKTSILLGGNISLFNRRRKNAKIFSAKSITTTSESHTVAGTPRPYTTGSPIHERPKIVTVTSRINEKVDDRYAWLD